MGSGITRWEWFEQRVPAQELLNYPKGGYPGPWGPTLTDVVKGKKSDELVPRPEHANFCLAMFAGGLVFGAAHLYGSRSCMARSHLRTNLSYTDYPWDSLGKATIVDVGGGVGMWCLHPASDSFQHANPN